MLNLTGIAAFVATAALLGKYLAPLMSVGI